MFRTIKNSLFVFAMAWLASWLDVNSVMGATYYCATNGSSDNTGLSASSPWPLDYAGTHVPSNATVIVAPGFYEGAQLDIEVPGTTWVVQPKWSAILSNQNPSGILIGYSSGASGVVVDGFEVANSWKVGIDIYTGTNTICNCWVHGSGFGQVSQNGSGIFCEDNGNVNHCVFSSNLLEDNGIPNDGPHNWGIYLNGTDHLVQNNVSRYNRGGGFTPPTTGTALFQNNFTYHNTFYGIAGTMSGGTVTIIGNTIIETNYAFFESGTGSFLLTNNIITAGPNINNGVNLLAGDYNLVSAPAFTQLHGIVNANPLLASIVTGLPQAHGVVNANPLLVNTNKGLYWLTAGSPARGMALPTAASTNDFFGKARALVSDVGAVQYSAAYATDTRILGPSPSSGADYWATLIRRVPGRKYVPYFRTDNPTSGSGEHFPVNWKINNMVTNRIYFVTDPPVWSWRELSFGVTATETNATLQYGTQNDQFGFDLDDVSVVAVFPPSLASQPTNVTVLAGGTATFSATTGGAAPLVYQWTDNGTNLPNSPGILGGTTPNLVLTNVSTNNAGDYALVVANAYGTITSSVATLTVILPATIAGIAPNSDGSMKLQFGGSPGVTYVLESTTNLVSLDLWLPVATNMFDLTGLWQFTDPQTTNFLQKYYRLKYTR
jgi:hypothetical protein